MSDTEKKKVGVVPDMRGGWHTPSTTVWREVADAPVAEWRVPALPDEFEEEPDIRGGWHLPAPEDTLFTTGQELKISDGKAIMEDLLRPEDLIADLMTKPAAKPAAPGLAAPEDFIPVASSRPAAVVQEIASPEDFELPVAAPKEIPLFPDDTPLPTSAETALPPDDGILMPDEGEAVTEAVTDAELSAALEELDDDEEAFSFSEWQALASLDESGAMNATGVDTAELTPAQKALFAAATDAAEVLPTPAPASTQGESPADIAARMARELAGEAPPSATSMTGAVTMAGTPGQEDPAAFAARMARELASEGTSPSTPTQQFNPQQAALAQKFVDTQNQVKTLRAQYQAGQITYDDLQRRLQSLTILDDNQNWWMIGVETDKWYRFDNPSQQWQESTPPVPLTDPRMVEYSSPADVATGSLAYMSVAQPPVDPAATMMYGTPGGQVLPNPDQPIVDGGRTMVGPSASVDFINDGEASFANTGGYGTTMPSAGVGYDNTMPAAGMYDNAPLETPYDTGEPPAYDTRDVYMPDFEQQRQTERSSAVRILALAGIAAVACILLTLGGGVAFAMFSYQEAVTPYEDDIAALRGYKPEFQTVSIRDAQGNEIAELNSLQGGARIPVTLDEVSPYLIHAILAVENRTFYEDPGFSIPAIVRAFLQNVASGEVESGASTITQQIARNLILEDTTVSAERKLNEVLVANRIAQDYTKNEILALYLNEFNFGNLSYGVEAAAQFYFDKSAKDVNFAESAMLAGLIQSPAGNDPVVNIDNAKTAMRNSIRLMLEADCLYFQHGTWGETGEPFCINEQSVDPENGQPLVRVNANGTYGGVLAVQLARVETRRYLPREAQFQYPHFVNFVQTLVETEFGADAMFQRGFTIYTTLEPRVQDAAQNALSQQVAGLVNNGVNTGAVMVTDPRTGAIRALVGSPDFSNEAIGGQVDNTRTYQQPGSSIKPVVYAAAMDNLGGTVPYLTPGSILWDVPSQYNIDGVIYTPSNFVRGRFYGPVTLREALQGSYNISAVKAYEFIGNDRFKQMAEKLGLRFVDGTLFGLPSALGANDVRLIDMMKVYGTFANNGQYVPLYAIDRITENINGQEVQVPMQARPATEQKISPQIAYLMQNILSDDASRRQTFPLNSAMTLVNRGINPQGFVAAKSGTSNDNRDLWTMGFTKEVVVGVWLGTFDNAPTVNTTSLEASAVWNATLVAALGGRSPAAFGNPGGVVQDTMCRDTGTLASETCANRYTEIYIQTLPPPPAGQGIIQNINIDSWTNLRANEWCPENVVTEVYAAITDPFAINWLNTTAEGRSYKQRVGLPEALNAAPAQACTQGQVLPTVRLNNPQSNQTLTGNVTITGQITAPDFQRYELQYAPVGSTSFLPIGQASTQQFQNAGSTIGTWDTTRVTNGQYTLRLAAYSTAGGYIFRDVTVALSNVPPTPTPAPPTPTTAAPIATVAPLPFDSQPAAPIGGATPTLGGING